MRIVSVFAFILVSISLLSESYHYVGAIGLDSASHGLLYGGRVVRRYEDMYKVLQKRRILDSQTQPEQQTEPGRIRPNSKIRVRPTNPTQDVKIETPQQQPPQQQQPAQDQSPGQTQPSQQSPPPKQKGNKSKPADDTTDTTVNNPPPSNQKQNQQGPVDQSDLGKGGGQGDNGTPTVATGSLSSAAVAGLASVGGVFVLVGGLFAFSQRRKNKEITKSIVSSSSKAWEQQQQQNSAYEIMEETKPIGTYLVVATYTPTLSDELEIQIGDKVTILKEYDDGWVLGVNETRDGIKEGVFPRHCVDMDNTSDKFDKAKAAKRSSSMGVYAAGGYTEVDLN